MISHTTKQKVAYHQTNKQNNHQKTDRQITRKTKNNHTDRRLDNLTDSQTDLRLGLLVVDPNEEREEDHADPHAGQSTHLWCGSC